MERGALNSIPEDLGLVSLGYQVDPLGQSMSQGTEFRSRGLEEKSIVIGAESEIKGRTSKAQA